MIRFACPGCRQTFTVDDSKGGKPGTCPQCRAAFLIPAAAAPPTAPALPPPPRLVPVPPPGGPAPVEVRPCPGCGARLSVDPDHLGADVECPHCRTTFQAVGRGPSGAGDKPHSLPRATFAEEDDRPSRRRRDDDSDWGDEDDYRPPRQRPSQGLGVASLVLGVISLVVEVPALVTNVFGVLCCCFLPIAWAGHAVAGVLALVGLPLGLVGMRQRAGKGMATAGVVMNALSLLGAVVGGVLSVLGVALFPVGPVNNPPPNFVAPPPPPNPPPPPPPQWK